MVLCICMLTLLVLSSWIALWGVCAGRGISSPTVNSSFHTFFWFNSCLFFSSCLLTVPPKNCVFYAWQLIISCRSIFHTCSTQNTKILITFQSPIRLDFTPYFSVNSGCCKESVSVRQLWKCLYKS